uniref:Uncharacterized protein n=1 Tax=Opuntia streptacantha TaxID=393608 RepID=A0A7C9AJY5_OPUST
MQHSIRDEGAGGSQGNAGCCGERTQRRHRSFLSIDEESDPPKLNAITKHLQIVSFAHLKSSHHSMSVYNRNDLQIVTRQLFSRRRTIVPYKDDESCLIA